MACTDKNPLSRQGIDQQSRSLAALLPDFARVDERSVEDLMLFARRYAAYIKYKNQNNADQGTWEPLMQQDVSVVLAMLLSIDLIQVSDYIKLIYKKTKLAIAAADDAEAQLQFKYLFDAVLTLVKNVDEQCSLLKNEPEYQQTLVSLIQTKLNQPFWRLLNFKNDHGSLVSSSHQADSEAPFNPVDSNLPLSLIQFTPTADKLKITVVGSTIAEQISHVINHNLFNNQISLLLSGLASVLQNAESLFQKSLTEYDNHEPHYGLFIAFLRLFKEAQDSLNEFTGKHLDFYYKDVLRLKNKPAVADQAHVAIALQKHIPQHLLKKGTLFKGGKDPKGKERQYSLAGDVVFNQAEVQSLKAFQIFQKRLLAYPQINSSDGIGGKFEAEDKSWFAFGDRKMAPTLEAGFAIASNLLFLNEGKRTITLRMEFANPVKSSHVFSKFNPFGNKRTIPFSVSLTGEKAWIDKSVNATYSQNSTILELKFVLEVDEPAVVPYLEKIHQKGFATSLPLLTAKLDQAASNLPYADLMNNPLLSLQLKVDVDGVKNLALSSDGGSIDASKPFKPFGDFPKLKASFYIGSREIFQKELESLTVNFPVNEPMTCQYLHGNVWDDYPFSKTGNAYLIQKNISSNYLKPTLVNFGAPELLKATAFEGFLRFRLNTGKYSLASHMAEVNRALDNIVVNSQQGNFQLKPAIESAAEKITAKVDIGNLISKEIDTAKFEKIGEIAALTTVSGNSVPVPKEVISETFSIDYIASSQIPLEGLGNDRHKFYHLTPFGHYQPISSGESSLVPKFSQEGELLVGLAKVQVPGTVNLLFLLADGSSNPLKSQESVAWSFLDASGVWVDFEKGKVIDGTINLTRTGIVTISLPAEAVSTHTALPTGLVWVRASVLTNTDAVCKIIDIKAQGALVELVQEHGLGTAFLEHIPAGTISKLKLSDNAIKSIAQPADSKGGKTEESSPDFYRRVSERLRHKQRATTIWDYEHLVLQEFPEIHQIKCLNHTGFYEKSGEKVFCENFPGHVTLICIPDLHNKSNRNPLRPYTPIGTLTDIDIFLQKIKNPFAQLHVVNPSFEEVQVEFEVRLHDNMDETFYRNLLDLEIEQFLCPWAWDLNQKLVLGGKINKSTLINFVEERPYVDFVSCFKLHHIIRDDNGKVVSKFTNLEEVAASTARSVLVSHFEEANLAAPRHLIEVVQTCSC
jgi:hypothetical protein